MFIKNSPRPDLATVYTQVEVADPKTPKTVDSQGFYEVNLFSLTIIESVSTVE